MKTPKLTKIAIVVNLANASWRDFLRGFLEAIHEFQGLNLKILDPADFSPEKLQELEHDNFSALVVGDPREDTAAQLAMSPMQVELVGSLQSPLLERRQGFLHIHHDDEDIGRFAADEFARLGEFNSWGFIPGDRNPQWTRLRLKGFRDRLSHHGVKLHTYSTRFPSGSPNDRLRLAKWLKELPKPAAIFTAFEDRALEMLNVCHSEKISVPGQVSVIVGDNDPLICDYAKPTLSSIAPDHVGEGRLAAIELSKLLRSGKPTTARTVLFTKKQLIERESSSFTPPAVTLVRAAKAYINENALRAITVAEVAAHVEASRSLLDMRFRQCESISVAAYIRDRRLFEVRKRLKAEHRSINSIARECSFENVNHLRNLFKRRYGISMREFKSRM